jgi:hypothetical protein
MHASVPFNTVLLHENVEKRADKLIDPIMPVGDSAKLASSKEENGRQTI